MKQGEEPQTIHATPTRTGTYPYYCYNKLLWLASLREKGMEGTLEVIKKHMNSRKAHLLCCYAYPLSLRSSDVLLAPQDFQALQLELPPKSSEIDLL
jgi:hypothetical protein